MIICTQNTIKITSISQSLTGGLFVVGFMSPLPLEGAWFNTPFSQVIHPYPLGLQDIGYFPLACTSLIFCCWWCYCSGVDLEYPGCDTVNSVHFLRWFALTVGQSPAFYFQKQVKMCNWQGNHGKRTGVHLLILGFTPNNDLRYYIVQHLCCNAIYAGSQDRKITKQCWC